MGLVLGTVQLGLAYGISNTSGKPTVDEVNDILSFAQSAGIKFFDTAAAYGDSELLLGQSSVPAEQIITKVSSVIQSSKNFHEHLSLSLSRLRRESIYGLMFHDASDLECEQGTALLAQALEAKREGLVKKVGASVYSPVQARRLLDQHDLDLIQIPYSIFDQRAEKSGLLRELQASNVEVHARSVFLQGLLLMSPSELPAQFASVRGLLEELRRYQKQQGQDALSSAIHFVRANTAIDHMLVGVNRRVELEEVVQAFKCAVPKEQDWSGYALADEVLLNPSNWKH